MSEDIAFIIIIEKQLLYIKMTFMHNPVLIKKIITYIIHGDGQRGNHKVVLEWSGAEQGGWRGGQPGGWQGGGGLEVLVIYGESADKYRCCTKMFSCRKSLKVHIVTTYWRKAFCILNWGKWKFALTFWTKLFRSNRPNNDSAAEMGWRWSQRGQGWWGGQGRRGSEWRRMSWETL